MITGMSLLLMAAGFYLAWTDSDGPAGKQALFTLMGILGILISSKLIELEERTEELESKLSGSPRVRTGLPDSSSVEG